MQLIGIDTGGTFTDTVVSRSDGRIALGKALTTHDRLMDGVLDSLTVSAQSMGVSVEEMLAKTDILSHGTTVGLNALLTGTGAKVGLLVTEGFVSTLPIARANKVHGLSDDDFIDALKWRKPPLLVPRRHILGVRERIDVRGNVLTKLDEEHAREQIRRLLKDGIEAIGVSLIWAPVNGSHEQRLAQLIAEEAPAVHVTLSSELAPRIGEYERTATVAMNAYIAPMVSNYLRTLEEAVRQRGFKGLFLIMTMGGGVQQAASLCHAPVHVLQSGPVGGITASQRLGGLLGHPNVIATDVGGTSFDVGLVVEGMLPRASRPRVGRHSVAVPVVDLASIGTGGGSIAWVDKSLGVLHVGPQSAGSSPGPACYGRGGSRPTVTDAAVVLGYLDRLGGSLKLDRAAALAVVEALARPLNLDVYAAAEGILRVANAQMADLVRRASIQRGHDPRGFVLYAYGGAAPQYVGRYAAEIGVKAIVIPQLAPEFSAWGAVCSDLRSLAELELPPRPFKAPLDACEEAFALLEARTLDQLRIAGSELKRRIGSEISVQRRVGLRFERQIHRVDIPVGNGPLDAAAISAAAEAFRGHYERIVGRGSAYSKSVVELAGVSVELRAPVPVPKFARLPARTMLAATRKRRAWFDGSEADVPVYLWSDLSDGAVIHGPAFVESEQTTAVIYPGQQALSDAAGNLRLEVRR